MNGSRVNAIVDELRGEKIDIVNWDENPGNLIQNALSPAKIVAVFADPDEKTAKVVVPDYQLSLAIGKEGQNARLAARLTGYKIDIKSETQAKDAPGFRYEDYLDDGYDDEEEEYEDDYEEGAEEALKIHRSLQQPRKTARAAMNKKIPMRQCVGCGEMKNKREMMRVLKTPEGPIVLDATEGRTDAAPILQKV